MKQAQYQAEKSGLSRIFSDTLNSVHLCPLHTVATVARKCKPYNVHSVWQVRGGLAGTLQLSFILKSVATRLKHVSSSQLPMLC